MKKGFTLIELMIVVAIIAIIAAIAIPNLLASRREANETNAVAALKTYAANQSIFKKGNFSAKIVTTVVQEYAYPFTQLYTTSTTPPIDLISPVFAAASTYTSGYQGYWFSDDTAKTANKKWTFGLVAHPCVYGNSGISTYYIDEKGVVYQKDLGTGSDSGSAAQQSVNLQTETGWVVP